jgi:hypothetical protein
VHYGALLHYDLATSKHHELPSKSSEQQEQITELGRQVAELEVERADLASRDAMPQKLATICGDSAVAAADMVGLYECHYAASC